MTLSRLLEGEKRGEKKTPTICSEVRASTYGRLVQGGDGSKCPTNECGVLEQYYGGP